MREDSSPLEKNPSADRGRHIVRGVGSLTIQSLLNAILGFILLASLIRFLSQTDYGAYSGVQVSVGIAGVIATFGLGSAAVHFLASTSTEEGSQGWGAAKAAIYLTVGMSGAVSLAFVAAAPYLSDYFLKRPSDAWLFYLGAAWLFTSSVSASVQALLQGMRRYALLAEVLLASRFIAVGIAVAGLLLYQSLTIAVVSQVLYAILIFLAVLPAVLGPLRRANPKPHSSLVLRYAFPLGLAGLVAAIAGNADIVVVGGYLNPGSLAIYNATVQISSVLSALLVAPLVIALFAETSLSSESEAEIRVGTSLAVRFSMVTVLPASLFAASMAPQLFSLFSGNVSYSQGIPFLELITLFYVFTAVQTIAINILQGIGETRKVLVVGVITALGEVALSAFLVPGFGLAGAAFSRVVIFVMGCGLSLYFIRQYLPRPVDFAFFVKALVASGVPALAVYVPSVLLSNRLLTLLPYTVIGVGFYLLSAKFLKLLNEDDRKYISHLLPAGLQWVTRLI